MAQSETNEFLKDLGIPVESILDKPLDLESAPEKEDDEKKEAVFKNRFARRKEAEAQRLREENIQLNERIKVLSEVGKFKEEIGDDYLKKVEAIYGTNTPEKLAATNLLKEALQGVKTEAVKEWEERGAKQSEAEKQAEKEADSEVDTFLETAEDYGLDTSDDNVRKGLITLMEKMSKKYDDGNIKEFADDEAVIETFQELQKRQTSSRARELASRGMTRSGESQPSKLESNAIDRFMEEQGLGW